MTTKSKSAASAKRISIRHIAPWRCTGPADWRKYSAMMRAGDEFFPMGVIGQSSKLRGYPYRLFDGMHQARAAKHIGRRTIAARVIADERASIVTRKPKPLNDPRHTATHEAGHAVIARVLTLLCEGASIVPDHEAGHAGHSITGDPWECETEWLRRGKVRHDNAVWHARIISCMAGAEAEAVLLGSTEGGDGDDRYQIELIAKELLDCDAAQWVRYEARLRAMTRMLIRRHRDRIERVADALLADGELSAEQIDLLASRSVSGRCARRSDRAAYRKSPVNVQRDLGSNEKRNRQ